MVLPFRRNAKKPPDSAWVPGDSIPAPDVVQKETDSVWALWNEVTEQHEAGFTRTKAAPPPPEPAAENSGWADTSPSGYMLEEQGELPPNIQAQTLAVCLEDAVELARSNNRVCLRPQRWDELRAMLPSRKTVHGLQKPPPAVTGAMWAATPERAKRICFREHMEWAERVDVLEPVMEFLRSVPEEDWLHAGEK